MPDDGPDVMFPQPVAVARRPCPRCRKPTRVDRAVQGYGSDCAALLGLTTATPRLRTEPQTGITLLDLLEGEPHDQRDEEPHDHCDGWDR